MFYLIFKIQTNFYCPKNDIPTNALIVTSYTFQLKAATSAQLAQCAVAMSQTDIPLTAIIIFIQSIISSSNVLPFLRGHFFSSTFPFSFWLIFFSLWFSFEMNYQCQFYCHQSSSTSTIFTLALAVGQFKTFKFNQRTHSTTSKSKEKEITNK